MELSLGISTAWDLAPRATHDIHLRLAPEVKYRWSSFTMGAVAYLGLVDMLQTDSPYTPGLTGAVIFARYKFTDKYELALRFAGIWVLEKLRDDASANARSLVDAQADDPAKQDLADKLSLAGHLHSEQEVTLGFNWYLYENTLKWSTDLGLVMHDMDDGQLLDARLRTQLQLAF